MPGSGKSEAVKALLKKALVVRMGDCVWEEVKKRGMELNEKNVGYIANSMREKYGKSIWAKRTIKKIKGSDLVIIDGIRCIEEVEEFKSAFGKDFFLVVIHAPANFRYQRILKRKRKDDTLTFEEFERRERRELGWGLNKVIEKADYTIINDGSLEDLKRKIEKLVDSIQVIKNHSDEVDLDQILSGISS